MILRVSRRLGSRGWAVSLGLLLGGATRQPGRPAAAQPRARAAAPSSTSSTSRSGRASTSPTAPSSPAALLAVLLSLRGHRARRHRAPDAPARTSTTHDGAVTSRRSAARPRGARRPAARRRDQPPVRPEPHRRRRPGQRRRRPAWTASCSAKSERVTAGAVLDVDLPEPERSPLPPAAGGRGAARRARGRRPARRRQAGRRRRPPEPGLGRARPSSAGSPPPATGSARAAPRSGRAIVHRLDVGTSGLMVVAKSERAYTVLKDAFRERTVDKRYHALVQGHPDPLERHGRRADRPPPDQRLQVRRRGRRARQRHPLRDARGVPARLAARGPPRDRAHPPDPRAHGGAQAPLRRRRHLRRRPDAVQAARPRAAVAARRARCRSPTPTTGAG